MSRVVFSHVAKTYANGVRAVVDLNLQIEDDEFFVLVGPSGCGKTTTLRLVAGLEDPSAGEIFLGDRSLAGVAPAKRDVAMVLQHAALYPHMTVAQNMAFGLRMRGTPRAEIDARVRTTAETLAIGSLLARRPAELSGGQRRRAAIGRAIVRAPHVYLFDEPLSDLDQPLRIQLRPELRRLHDRLATTTIYVTHDQVEAMTLGDRIGVMECGEIRQFGTPQEVYQRPASAFVASFIGSPGMNLIAGEVRQGVFRWRSGSSNGSATGGECAVGGAISDAAVLLGVRPTDFLTGAEGPTFGSARVELVERLGHETLVQFALAGGLHYAQLPADAAVKKGHMLPLRIRPGSLHVFSAADGRRLG